MRIKNQVRWISVKRKLPACDRIVWCLREWTPTGIIGKNKKLNNNPQCEVVLAKRCSERPLCIWPEDAAKDAWWHGFNEKDGCSWSDTTVTAWRELDKS